MWARVKLNRQKITISRVPEAVPQMCSSQKVFTFLQNTSGRLLLEFLCGTAPGKMVKWQKSNGGYFQMFQKQSPSGVFLKRSLSHCKKFNRIMVSTFRIFSYKDRIYDPSLYGKIQARENPQPDIIQAVSFLRNTSRRLFLEFLWGTASGKTVNSRIVTENISKCSRSSPPAVFF